MACLLLAVVVVISLHVGDLHAVGWSEGPWALVTPVKAIRVGVGVSKNTENIFQWEHFNQRFFCANMAAREGCTYLQIIIRIAIIVISL